MCWGSVPGMAVFFFASTTISAQGPTQPTQWIKATSSSRIKWSRHEANHIPPTNAEVNNVWSYTLFIYL
jgi:hypothetical protein